jgi:hypothetical protein
VVLRKHVDERLGNIWLLAVFLPIFIIASKSKWPNYFSTDRRDILKRLERLEEVAFKADQSPNLGTSERIGSACGEILQG